MKSLVLGDIHLKARRVLPSVDAFLADDPRIERVVFCGDYCDDWAASSKEFCEDIEYLAAWVSKARDSGMAVDMVFGNHDFQYLLRVPGPGTKPNLYGFVNETLFPLGLRMAHVVDGFLVTHAGLVRSWAERFLDGAEEGTLDAEDAAEQLNLMLDSPDKANLDLLDMAGFAVGGFEMPSPLWARPIELLPDLPAGISQIVGHTPVERACKASEEKTGADRQIWFCDTFSTWRSGRDVGDGSALLVEDGVVSVASLKRAPS